MPSRTSFEPGRLVSCKYCHQGGLAWREVQAGRWRLYRVQPGTQSPDLLEPHNCPFRPYEVHQVSHKPNTWRRNKSPGSYG